MSDALSQYNTQQTNILRYADYLEEEHKRIIGQLRPTTFEIASLINPFAMTSSWDMDQLYLDPAVRDANISQYPNLFELYSQHMIGLDLFSLYTQAMAALNQHMPTIDDGDATQPTYTNPTIAKQEISTKYNLATQQLVGLNVNSINSIGQQFIANVIDARYNFSLAKFDSEIAPRINAGMRDLNAVMSSQFPIARAVAIRDIDRSINELQAQLNFQLSQLEITTKTTFAQLHTQLNLTAGQTLAQTETEFAKINATTQADFAKLDVENKKVYAQVKLAFAQLGAQFWQSMLQWHIQIPEIYGKMLTMFTAQRIDIENHNAELTAKACLWPYTVFGQYAGLLSTMSNATTSNSEVSGESKSSTGGGRIGGILGGAISGAVGGSTMGPYGAAVGGVFGAIGGVFK